MKEQDDEFSLTSMLAAATIGVRHTTKRMLEKRNPENNNPDILESRHHKPYCKDITLEYTLEYSIPNFYNDSN
ncbi:15919_t:CDS:2 [Funneliformis mosseae]|uniref:15919_t:CDS:1 n=1 Tax=Funneliformis mosseae TaxID=27381 RepID=A0A9N9H721_FUNMO|nr:15919_t:CDS:2 [Funneliformis mosseae]